ncbi:Eaa protein [Escherichia coli]|nr:Eaa protein [Escherichia coli]SQT72321.1 Eaa protein [Escherichia coli]HAH0885179.1 DUF551 domain-containing protein [Escherichia coli]HAH1013846.1 DUF551 domain-containing protein [Escherichia coli]HCO7163884.1 DUF551 domain-containing protein [Escherichia coli]
MTTITREQALKIIEAADEVISALAGTNEDVHPGSDNMLRLWDDLNDRYAPPEVVRELARIALASLEAEPVGAFHIAEQQVDGTSDYLKDGEWPIDNGIIEVYAAPPVPVVPAALPENDDEDGHDIDYLEPSEVYALGRTAGWNACRAAMLQGSQPVSQTYKFPVNTPCQDAPAHIWLQTAGVWPEDGELSELTWCSHNQHHDDTLYVRADLVNGNSPVTPDGWISCSEQMPDDGQHVIILCDGAFVLYAQYRDGEFFDVVRNGEEFFETQSRNVTDWMPLPEPPQEVNRG